MHEQLKEFLSNQGEKGAKTGSIPFDGVWDEKKNYIEDICFEYTRFLDLLFEKNEPSFSDRLANSYQKFPPGIFYSKDNLSDSAKENLSNNPLYDDKVLIEIFKELLSENYTPPSNLTALQFHLNALSLFYFYLIRTMNTISLSVIFRIDFAMAKAASEARIIMALIKDQGQRRLDRTHKSSNVKTEKKEKRKQPVLEAYYRVDKVGLKPHTIAKNIRRELEKTQMTPPSLDTIKRYLKEEGKI